MSLIEFVKGSGIYKIRKKDLPEEEQFVRNTGGKYWVIEEGSKKWKVYPLLHICERDRDPYNDTVDVILCDKLRWDFFYGHYICKGCRQTFSTREELGQVWADGMGTGDEVSC